MSKINVLSKEVSELIAAGEVIDKPASIIKELLENAIDAGANIITVEIKNGGRTYIRVTDNGSGISETDISKAFVRHATSKISDKDDLEKIMTLGFRGEALASISAVAKVEVLSKMANEEYGTHYVIEGSEEKLCEKSGCPDGTTFVVRDIFYNVPARLKFLKKDTTEANYVASFVTKLALSHPEISFKFIKDNKTELLTAGDGKLYSAIYAVFGRDFASSLIPVEYDSDDISITGYISKPLQSKNNRKFQNFFVNGRYIKSLTCATALEEAYKNNIMTGRFPACVLNLSIKPNVVDVNVHPTKIEVRFSDNKLIYNSVFFAVKNSLMKFDKPTDMHLETKRNFTDRELYDFPVQNDLSAQLQFAEKKTEKPSVQEPVSSVKIKTEPVCTSDVKETKSNDPDLYIVKPEAYKEPEITDNKVSTAIEPEVIYEAEKIDDDLTPEQSKAEQQVQLEQEIEDISEFKYIHKDDFRQKESVVVDNVDEPKVKPVVVGELFKTYIVAQAGEDMLLFDKHAAHERYIFEKIKNDANQLDTQMFLEPVMVLLSYEEYDALCLNIDKIAELGFSIEPDVAPTVAVMGVPLILADENPSEVITELARNFMQYKVDPQIELFDELFHSMACKAAIKANDDSSKMELQALVNAVYENDEIRYCPHGRPVMIKLSKKDIEKQFKRIV